MFFAVERKNLKSNKITPFLKVNHWTYLYTLLWKPSFLEWLSKASMGPHRPFVLPSAVMGEYEQPAGKQKKPKGLMPTENMLEYGPLPLPGGYQRREKKPKVYACYGGKRSVWTSWRSCWTSLSGRRVRRPRHPRRRHPGNQGVEWLWRWTRRMWGEREEGRLGPPKAGWAVWRDPPRLTTPTLLQGLDHSPPRGLPGRAALSPRGGWSPWPSGSPGTPTPAPSGRNRSRPKWSERRQVCGSRLRRKKTAAILQLTKMSSQMMGGKSQWQVNNQLTLLYLHYYTNTITITGFTIRHINVIVKWWGWINKWNDSFAI